MAGFTWNGDAARKRIEAEIGKRLDAAAILTLNHWRKLINVDGTGRSGTSKRARLVYGAHPSAPGEPPRKQTGRLLASTAWERDRLVARIGSNVKYLPPLEFGATARGLAARPSLHRALTEMQPQIRAILSRPIH